MSRSYYAMFSAATANLHRLKLTPPRGRQSWPHREIADLVHDHRRHELRGRRRDVRRMIRAAYNDRVVADYVSGLTVDDAMARRCVTNAATVVKILRECQ